MKQSQNNKLIARIYAWVLTLGGSLGLIAMTWQASERIHMLKNPGVSLNCNLNPVVDCGGVLGNKLAAILGFPNAFLGMIFFAILATSGLMLLSGGTFQKWYRHFVMAVATVLMMFSVWFFGVSLYILGKICIFCVVGWVVSVPIFLYSLIYYLQNSSKKLSNKPQKFTDFIARHHIDIIVVTYVLMAVIFLTRFREYYFG
ncbi:MAG: hypothetical protein QG628_337 [Patescibacteria group bacterium]|jgi:uncharacterized membrane protein|nr:hypothetical protein [Patescibacteria group bacterium]